VLALAVHPIGEGAGLAVEDDRHGRPRLRRWRNRERGCGAGRLVRQIGRAAAASQRRAR
jgi:hypothetical protein